MLTSEIDIKWLTFVRRLRVVGVLLIFIIIPFLAFVMIPIYFILTMVAVGDITKLNRELKDQYLQTFRAKYIAANIIKLIGAITVHTGATIVAFGYFFNHSYYSPYPYYYIFPFGIPSSAIVFIVGFIIMIVGSAVEIGAWDNLKFFIYHNKSMFPERTAFMTTNKVDNLRSGALCWALGFLVVTIIIGWIQQLVGYFGLCSVAEGGAKGETIKSYTYVQQAPSPPTPPTPPTPSYSPSPPYSPAQAPQTVNQIVFCPMCGARVTEGALYCGECGVKLQN